MPLFSRKIEGKKEREGKSRRDREGRRRDAHTTLVYRNPGISGQPHLSRTQPANTRYRVVLISVSCITTMHLHMNARKYDGICLDTLSSVHDKCFDCC
eukprot:COSAG02_NODE_96_length_37408_cov_9.762604_3_plen_98_part_00